MILALGWFRVPALEHMTKPTLPSLGLKNGLAWPVEKFHPKVSDIKRGTGHTGQDFSPLGQVALVLVTVRLTNLAANTPMLRNILVALCFVGGLPLR